MDDEHLLRRIADYDEESLCLLYDRWARQVYTLAAACTSTAEEADRLVEETFWHAWRAAPAPQASSGSVGAWLLDLVREQRAELAGSGAVARANDGGFERLARLLSVYAELSVQHRETLDLACFRGMELAEVAAHTGESPGAVRTRLRDALTELRCRLRDAGLIAG